MKEAERQDWDLLAVFSGRKAGSSKIRIQTIDKLDIFAISAHADDVEVAVGGTLLRHVAQGRKVGLLDLTEADLSARGNVRQRRNEAAALAKVKTSIEGPDQAPKRIN